MNCCTVRYTGTEITSTFPYSGFSMDRSGNTLPYQQRDRLISFNHRSHVQTNNNCFHKIAEWEKCVELVILYIFNASYIICFVWTICGTEACVRRNCYSKKFKIFTDTAKCNCYFKWSGIYDPGIATKICY